MAIERIAVTGVNSIQGNVVEVPSHQEINEKNSHTREDAVTNEKEADLGFDIKPAPNASDDGSTDGKDTDDENAIIITGADASNNLLPLRDDFEPALTFRSMFLASGLAAFQAVISQIYSVSAVPSTLTPPKQVQV